MMNRLFGNSWLDLATAFCVAASIALCSFSPVFGQGGLGIDGYAGFAGNPGFGAYTGFGGLDRYESFSRNGQSRLGYSGIGYSGFGYSNYYSSRPSIYFSPANSSRYGSPQYAQSNSVPNVVSRQSLGVNAQRSYSNAYAGPMSADGQPIGDLRPGMVLPDGAIVISVGTTSR